MLRLACMYLPGHDFSLLELAHFLSSSIWKEWAGSKRLTTEIHDVLIDFHDSCRMYS